MVIGTYGQNGNEVNEAKNNEASTKDPPTSNKALKEVEPISHQHSLRKLQYTFKCRLVVGTYICLGILYV